MTKLKPCPFCGNTDELEGLSVVKDRFRYSCSCNHYVHCMACFADGPPEETEEEAIKAWNERAE